MERFYRITAFICFLLLSVSCSFQVEKEIEQHPNPSNDEETSVARDNISFAIVYPVAHPFFEGVTMSATEAAEQLGMDIIIRAPATATVEEQIQIMDHLIQQNVQGIAIGPTDSAALTPFINKAVEAGIQVICFDTDAPESQRLSYIGTDNLAAGEHIGEVVARLINYEGSILISTGLLTMQNLNSRIDGVKKVINRYPDIEILDIRSSDGIPSKTILNIEEMIAEHPDFKALIGIDSLSGPAAVTVWKAQGIQDKVAVTFDDLPMTLEGVSNHQITSTISQRQYTWGKLIVERLHAANQGEPIPTFELTETLEVNADNIHDYISNPMDQ
ncbi:substrate-binding domain-containing protein [Bacillus alkalicellulosilyticus]|uniref:substrate-binding domain-containing protein n=1 Tax=Alkalihalobacterium alkalicellulosilyticum TaxID=1912214 RepID=UPI00099763B8|nr:substrate-binding domain-containing protein [Bacillus alkalicellulosilyticus]